MRVVVLKWVKLNWDLVLNVFATLHFVTCNKVGIMCWDLHETFKVQ